MFGKAESKYGQTRMVRYGSISWMATNCRFPQIP